MGKKVLDFVKKREQVVEKKRRDFERLMFDNFLGAYSVIDRNGAIYPIKLVDISRTGCLFQIQLNNENDNIFKKGMSFTFRMYFTQKEFIPTLVTIRNSRKVVEQDGTAYLHCGAEFDTSTSSFEALESFVQFLYSFAEHSVEDHGDAKVYFY